MTEKNSTFDLNLNGGDLEGHVPMRISEILEIKPHELKISKKIQSSGLHIESNSLMYLSNKRLDMRVELKFVCLDVPNLNSYIRVYGYLDYNDKPIVSVYLWNYISETDYRKMYYFLHNLKYQVQYNSLLLKKLKLKILEQNELISGQSDISDQSKIPNQSDNHSKILGHSEISDQSKDLAGSEVSVQNNISSAQSEILGPTVISDQSKVFGQTEVSAQNNIISIQSKISGQSENFGHTVISGQSKVLGQTEGSSQNKIISVQSKISGQSENFGHIVISGQSKNLGQNEVLAQNNIILDQLKISGQTKILSQFGIAGQSEIFGKTKELDRTEVLPQNDLISDVSKSVNPNLNYIDQEKQDKILTQPEISVQNYCNQIKPKIIIQNSNKNINQNDLISVEIEILDQSLILNQFENSFSAQNENFLDQSAVVNELGNKNISINSDVDIFEDASFTKDSFVVNCNNLKERNIDEYNVVNDSIEYQHVDNVKPMDISGDLFDDDN